ncbi:MAG: hypothetical protein AAGE84_22665 [Cyanobacteria bacterium P01_G01_bin.39]
MDDQELERRLDSLEQMQNQIIDNQQAIRQILEKNIKEKIDFIHFVVAFVVLIYVLRILLVIGNSI